MVKLVCGIKGTGKTKKLIQMANESLEKSKGDIVFIESNNKNNKHMFDINHDVRLINAMEFNINSIESFHGFLCGMIAADYDIQKVFIDGIYKLIDFNMDSLYSLIQKVEKLGEKFNIEFIMSFSCKEEELTTELKKYSMKN